MKLCGDGEEESHAVYPTGKREYDDEKKLVEAYLISWSDDSIDIVKTEATSLRIAEDSKRELTNSLQQSRGKPGICGRYGVRANALVLGSEACLKAYGDLPYTQLQGLMRLPCKDGRPLEHSNLAGGINHAMIVSFCTTIYPTQHLAQIQA